MLVGNKSDRVTDREVSTQEGSALAKDMGCDFVEASAKSCINVEKAFYEVVRALRRQRHDTPIIRTSTVRWGPAKGEGGKDKTGIRSGNRGDKPPKRCVIL